MMSFTDYWKANNGIVTFEKAKLTKSELVEVQNTIARLQKKGYPSSKIISALQKKNAKLSERWKAERAFWTEVKRDDTGIVGDLGEEVGFTKYKVILSPNACKVCVDKTNGGRKIFSNKDIEKAGYGQFVPWHPNCYCIAVPIA